MDLHSSLGQFVESRASGPMNEAASQLLEMLASDEVETLGAGGRPVAAEDLADRLEAKVERLRRQRDDEPEGLELIEETLNQLRASEGELIVPWTLEDSDGVRWFVLADAEQQVVACYTNAPFVEVET
jgi:hypothetical protein